MPTYEYRCKTCGTEFERFQKITAKPGAKCPRCGGGAQRLLSAGAGLVFKGSGFYITDYKRSGESKKQESGDSGEKASSTPPAPSGGDSTPKKKKKDD